MSTIEISSQTDSDSGVTVVKFAGNLDLTNFSKIKGFFEELGQTSKNVRCVVDISNVMFIASSIWAVFIARSRMAKLGGGKLVLCSMPDEIKGVYEAMNIETILPCADDPMHGMNLIRSSN